MSARFEVFVVPKSSARPGPAGMHGGLPRLRVKSPPVEGRANAEAERVLGEVLRTDVRLVGGARSRRKTFECSLTEPELDLRLGEAFG